MNIENRNTTIIHFLKMIPQSIFLKKRQLSYLLSSPSESSGKGDQKKI